MGTYLPTHTQRTIAMKGKMLISRLTFPDSYWIDFKIWWLVCVSVNLSVSEVVEIRHHPLVTLHPCPPLSSTCLLLHRPSKYLKIKKLQFLTPVQPDWTSNYLPCGLWTFLPLGCGLYGPVLHSFLPLLSHFWSVLVFQDPAQISPQEVIFPLSDFL